MKKAINNEKGFTLIEIMIGITVFSIGILAVATMQITAIRGNSSARDLSHGATLAQEKIEEFASLPYDVKNVADPLDDMDNDGKNGLDDDTAGTADHNETNGRYEIYWNTAVDHPIDNNKTIRVIVTWSDKGTQRHVSVGYNKADII